MENRLRVIGSEARGHLYPIYDVQITSDVDNILVDKDGSPLSLIKGTAAYHGYFDYPQATHHRLETNGVGLCGDGDICCPSTWDSVGVHNIEY